MALLEPPAPRSSPDDEPVRRAVAARPDDVARVLLELTRVVRDEDDLHDLLHRTAALAVELVDGVDCAGVTVLTSARPLTAACTDERVLEVDRRQYAAGEGPCLDAARHGRTVEVDLGEASDRYPRFTADARAAGIRSFLAAPLVGGGISLGALNLYGRGAGGFGALDAALVEVLTRQAGGAVAEYLRFADARQTAGQLEEAMRSRAVIEQAKGVLMAMHGVDADGAFALLRTTSQRRNVKLRDVAAELVAGVGRQDPVAQDPVAQDPVEQA